MLSNFTLRPFTLLQTIGKLQKKSIFSKNVPFLKVHNGITGRIQQLKFLLDAVHMWPYRQQQSQKNKQWDTKHMQFQNRSPCAII